MIAPKLLFEDIVRQLMQVYQANEAKQIAFCLLQHYLHLSRTEVLLNQPISQTYDFAPVIGRLLQHEPVQYVLGEAHFCGRSFAVNPAVLIPRPETEELVSLVFDSFKETQQPINLLDIGTGSGCIAITLSLQLAQAHVWAWDVSEDALAVAQHNAQQYGAGVFFEQIDVLEQQYSPTLPMLAGIVSNPPYVTRSEAAIIQPNVLSYEPHLALFVADDNPLLFYKKIIQIAHKHLAPRGVVCVEINEAFGETTRQLFLEAGFSPVLLLADIHGKERFVKAIK